MTVIAASSVLAKLTRDPSHLVLRVRQHAAIALSFLYFVR
jgi:ribonuclease HII